MTAKEASRSREPWVSVDDVADHLGVAKDTVYRWIESPAGAAGFAGVENELFYRPSTMMLFGDAKKSLLAIVEALKHL